MMKEFHFWGDWNDSLSILQCIKSNFLHCDFMIHGKQSTRIPCFLDVNDIKAYELLQKHSYLLIIDIHFPLNTYYFEEWDDGFIASTQIGGPYIEFDLPGCYSENGKINLVVGSISLREHYIHPVVGTHIAMPGSMIKSYFQIKKLVKSNIVAAKRNGKSVPVGKSAKRQIQEGTAILV